MELTAVLMHAEEGGFVALNPETGTTTQGETVEEAVANLKEATALYLSEFPMRTTGHPLVTMFTVPGACLNCLMSPGLRSSVRLSGLVSRKYVRAVATSS